MSGQLEAARLMAKCLEHIARRGIDVRQIDDPDQVDALLERVDKPYVTPLLDPAKNDFTGASSFWVEFVEDGTTTLVGGVRCDDLHGQKVTDFWRRILNRGYGDGATLPVGQFSPLCNERIHGKIVYFGDLFVPKDLRGDVDRVRCALAIAKLLSFQRWQPDFICGFVREEDIERGRDRVYGFHHAIPRAQTWAYAPASRGSTEWLVYDHADDVLHSVEYILDRIQVD